MPDPRRTMLKNNPETKERGENTFIYWSHLAAFATQSCEYLVESVLPNIYMTELFSSTP